MNHLGKLAFKPHLLAHVVAGPAPSGADRDVHERQGRHRPKSRIWPNLKQRRKCDDSRNY